MNNPSSNNLGSKTIGESKVCRLHKQEDIRVEVVSVDPPKSGEVLVKTAFGGICGSDLHYYLHGGIGPIQVKEPFILGHEFSGVVETIGSDVDSIKVGDSVAINPSHPCGDCEYCLADDKNHCANMRFLGSAMFFPHVQGGFREKIVVNAEQCYPAPKSLSLDKLATAEPLAIVLHAMNLCKSLIGHDDNDNQSDEKFLAGKKVLITGAGPIGCLTAAVAKYQQASEIVITDLFDQTLDVAKKMGASKTHNVLKDQESMSEYYQNKGYFDVFFECSSAPIAISNGLQALKPKGCFIQVGMSGEITFPMNYIINKELKLMGSFRFNDEFGLAVDYLSHGKIDVEPMITQFFAINDVDKAFQTAKDRNKSVKVQLAF